MMKQKRARDEEHIERKRAKWMDAEAAKDDDPAPKEVKKRPCLESEYKKEIC